MLRLKELTDKFNLKTTWILILVSLILCFYSAASLYLPPSISSDPGQGFSILKSMESGAPFNYEKHPTAEDISQDEIFFATWWTPGQYAIPGAIKHLFKIKLGHAIAWTIILFSGLGLWGFYKLFRLFGFDAELSAITILIISLQRYFNLGFSHYIGGDNLLFGFAPWMVLFALKYNEINFISFAGLILLSLFGFFLKSAFLIGFLALLLLLTLIKLFKPDKSPDNAFIVSQPNKKFFTGEFLFYLIKISAIGIITILITYLAFLSRGGSPASAILLNFNFDNLFFPIYGLILNSFSINELIGGFFASGNHSYPLSSGFSSIYFIPAIISCLLLACLISDKSIKLIYKLTLISFFIVYLAFFSFHYFKGSNINYSLRYFSRIAILFLPGILYLFYRNKNFKPVKLIFTLFIIFNCLYGLAGFFSREFRLKNSKPISKDGFHHELIDKEGLAILQRLDESLTQGNNLFYVTSPEISLDIKNNRSMHVLADFEPLEDLKKKEYFGTTDNLFLFLQKHFMSNGKEKVILGSFKDYKKFELINESPGFRVFRGIK